MSKGIWFLIFISTLGIVHAQDRLSFENSLNTLLHQTITSHIMTLVVSIIILAGALFKLHRYLSYKDTMSMNQFLSLSILSVVTTLLPAFINFTAFLVT